MAFRRSFALAAAALTMSASVAFAGDRVQPVVVELFTSQSCYSCPPAEKYLGELAARKDILALEFHVDYWDDLVYGSAGKWKDAFSKRAYTERQVGYNQRIRGRTNVYTPQMVIDGRLEAVGSRRYAVRSALRKASSVSDDRVNVDVTFQPGARGVTVALSGASSASSGVWLVRFIREQLTEVRAGENKGKSLVNHHIVTEMRRIGNWAGKPVSLSVNDFSLKKGEGCAVLVQDRRLGPILGAAACPAPVS